MKRILMLFIAVSLTYTCKSTKEGNTATSVTSKTIEKKIQQTWTLE